MQRAVHPQRTAAGSAAFDERALRRILASALETHSRYAAGAFSTAADVATSGATTPGLDLRQLHAMQEAAIRSTPPYPKDGFSGAGIVIPAGGPRYFTGAWVTLNLLRRALGCTLPVEVWYLGPEEMSPRMIELLEPLDVVCVDASSVRRCHPVRRLGGWELKPYSLIHSAFREVIFLDADNAPAINLAELLSWAEYRETGALFWPDTDHLGPDHPIWEMCRVPYRDEPTFESGQMVIDKERHWAALQFAMHLSEHSDLYYPYTRGDKETFHMAWRRLDSPYRMPAHPPIAVENCLGQRDFAGNLLFQHRISPKWIAWGENPRIPGFRYHDECLGYLAELRGEWNGRASMPRPVTVPGLPADEEILQTRRFLYVRIGSDQRTLELLPDHTIGDGSQLCEVGWHLEGKGGAASLVLDGVHDGVLQPTCRLVRESDGVWRGSWLSYEQMPVELIPQDDDADSSDGRSDRIPDDLEAVTRDVAFRAATPGERVEAPDLETLERILMDPASTPSTKEQAIYVLGACLYARADLALGPVASCLRAILTEQNLPPTMCRLGGELSRLFLAAAPAADGAGMLEALLASPELEDQVYGELLESLDYLRCWRKGLLDPETMVSLVEQKHLAPYREGLLEQAVERSLMTMPEAVTPAVVERLVSLYSGNPDFRYSLYYLARRESTPAPTRSQAERALAGRFPLHERVAQGLRQGRAQVLMIQNIADAQGDEIIRTVPLLQALLDMNEELEVTLVTARAYLYSHPRLRLVPLEDRNTVRSLLEERFDAVFNFLETEVLEVNHDLELQQSVEEHRRAHRPFLFVASRKGHNHFAYERVEVEGAEHAAALGLDRYRVPNVYEATFRLIAELGLPPRVGEDRPRFEPVLAGSRCPEAEGAWAELVKGNVQGRPVALVNPFGGAEPLKGYTEPILGRLVERLEQLIAEGYFLILLPNGTPWGSDATARTVVDRLHPQERSQVAVAPDPAAGSGTRLHPADASLAIPHASHGMHLVTHFVRFADLVVTVEGWMAHAAYCLARPFRVAMLPYSHPFEWHPHGCSPAQDIVLTLPGSVPNENEVGSSGLRGEKDSADTVAGPEDEELLCEQPRKSLLLFALRALGASGDRRGINRLVRALGGEDWHVRLAAAEALVCHEGHGLEEVWLFLLKDRAAAVRGVAAEKLLDMGADWSHRLGASYRGQLRAHHLIGQAQRDWGAVIGLGDSVMPALDLALEDLDPVIRREARQVLRILAAQVTPAEEATSAVPRPAISSRAQQRPGSLVARLLARPRTDTSHGEKVLILTPVKDADEVLDGYFRLLRRLTYPHRLMSIGFLESDSSDGTWEALRRKLPGLRREFRQAEAWKRDFGYHLPPGIHRGSAPIQMERRAVLARSRNHLLSRALADEDWVLWLDADLIDYPPDIVERLLATGKEIVQPHCVLDYGGRTFDTNGWREHGRLHLDDLREEGELVELDAVGATMLWVRADLHRDGLIFPAFPYGLGNPLVRPGRGELETEGLGMMARDMGYRCWGMPHLEIRHRRG